jgi:anti-sigma factor RsiW
MTGPGHGRHRDDTGAYVLGALGDAERREFELHLEGCAECREEVERLRPAADALPRSVDQLRPPERLRAAIMAEVERDARAAGGAPARPALAERLRRRLAGEGGLRPALAAGVLVVALAAGFLAGSLLDRDERQTTTIAAQVDGRRLPLASASLSFGGDGSDGAVLTAEGLSALPPSRVYQAWVLEDDGRIVPQPTFVAGRDGAGSVGVPADLSHAKAVMVTRERRGGARVPGERPVMRVDL